MHGTAYWKVVSYLRDGRGSFRNRADLARAVGLTRQRVGAIIRAAVRAHDLEDPFPTRPGCGHGRAWARRGRRDLRQVLGE